VGLNPLYHPLQVSNAMLEKDAEFMRSLGVPRGHTPGSRLIDSSRDNQGTSNDFPFLATTPGLKEEIEAQERQNTLAAEIQGISVVSTRRNPMDKFKNVDWRSRQGLTTAKSPAGPTK
jgi:hypothetical protein